MADYSKLVKIKFSRFPTENFQREKITETYFCKHS